MTGSWLVWPSLCTVLVFALVVQANTLSLVLPPGEGEEEPPPPKRTRADWWEDVKCAAFVSGGLWLYTLAVRLLP